MNDHKRNLYYIDIMRAVCCFGVFVEHFTACFGLNYLRILRAYTQFTPFLFINDGRLGINMFCTIGGFLIFYHSFDNELNIKRDRIKFTIVKRFLYMYISCAVICVLSVLLIRAGLLFNNRAYLLGAEEYLNNVFSADPTLHNLLICLKGIIYGQTLFAPQLWTMKYDLIIGTASLSLLFVSGNNRKLRWGLYAVFFILVLIFGQVSFTEAFLCGMISAELCRTRPAIRLNRFIAAAGMILSLTASACAHTLGRNLLVPLFDAVFLFLGYHIFGDKKITDPILKYITGFGSITFSFYLCHYIIIVTLSSALYCLLANSLPHKILFVLDFPVSFALAVVVSVIYHKFFMNRLSVLIKKTIDPGK